MSASSDSYAAQVTSSLSGTPAAALNAGVLRDSTPMMSSNGHTYGALMIGTFVGLILYGFTLYQVYRYVRMPAFRTDSLYIKGTVALVLMLETWISSTAMHALYYYLVSNYSRPDVLSQGVWSFDILPLSTGLVVAVSQSFFARQLWLINRRFRPLVVFIVLMLLGETGVTTVMTVQAYKYSDISRFEDLSWTINAGLGMIIAADGLLTALLTIVLRRSRTGFTSTDSMINILVMYTINTGLLTGTLSVVSLFLAIFYPRSFYADGTNMCIAKLYANSLLAVLNSRQFVRERGAEDRLARLSRSVTEPPTGVHNAPGTTSSRTKMGLPGAIEIKLSGDIVQDASSSRHVNQWFELERFPDRNISRPDVGDSTTA